MAITPAGSYVDNGGGAASGGGLSNPSVALTGTPTAPTGTVGDNTTQIATDAFVTTAITNAIAGVNPAVAVQAHISYQCSSRSSMVSH